MLCDKENFMWGRKVMWRKKCCVGMEKVRKKIWKCCVKKLVCDDESFMWRRKCYLKKEMLCEERNVMLREENVVKTMLCKNFLKNNLM